MLMVKFYLNSYINDLQSQLLNAVNYAVNDIYDAARANINHALQPRHRKNFYLAASLNKIVDVVRTNVISGTLTAGGTENSYIAPFYEYGTGTLAEDVGIHVQDPNPLRTGREIVGRPAGVYRVLDNFTQRSKGRRAGVPLPHYELPPSHFMRNAVTANTTRLQQYLLTAIKLIPITKYIVIEDIKIDY
jgi:hypothetical protein